MEGNILIAQIGKSRLKRQGMHMSHPDLSSSSLEPLKKTFLLINSHCLT